MDFYDLLDFADRVVIVGLIAAVLVVIGEVVALRHVEEIAKLLDTFFPGMPVEDALRGLFGFFVICAGLCVVGCRR